MTKLQKYADATLLDLIRVVSAAEDLYAAIAEFPDDPTAWEDDVLAFDAALEACPGSNAHFHAKKVISAVASEAEQRFRDRFKADKCDEMTDDQWGAWVDVLPPDEFWAMIQLGLDASECDKPT